MKQPLTIINQAGAILRRGGVGVLPTDTLYGIVGSALSKKAVDRIYQLRRRNLKKPMIILIASACDLAKFGVFPSPKIKKLLKRWWPGKVSIVLPISHRGKFLMKFSYLHRGTGTLAFRLPASIKLKTRSGYSFNLNTVLRASGPLIAPSANFEGEPPAKTIQEAEKYFGGKADFYIDVGRRDAQPSALIKIEDDQMIILRGNLRKKNGG